MSETLDRLTLAPEMLRYELEPTALRFDTTAALEPTDEIIGQEMAVEAIRLGLELESFGYNIFITGLVGTGRNTVVKKLLLELSSQRENGAKPELDDFCYVHDFDDADMPELIRLPAGEGCAFGRAMDGLVDTLEEQLPLVFESEAYAKQRDAILDIYRRRQAGLIERFQKSVEAEGFTVVQVQMGPVARPEVAPTREGEPVPFETLEKLESEGALPPGEVKNLRVKHAELQGELQQVAKETRSIEKALRDRVTQLDRAIVRDALQDLFSEIRARFKHQRVDAFLDRVEEDVLDHAEGFKKDPGGEEDGEAPTRAELYRVNVIVDNGRRKTQPIIEEPHPTYRGLFGTVEGPTERESSGRANFSHLRAGALLRADGGFLLLNAQDVFTEPGVWPALKRTLRTGRVQIQLQDPAFTLTQWGSALKPEPIRINTKVVLIGDSQMYDVLYGLDADFRKIFKVKAEFDAVMPLSDDSVDQYARFVATICRAESLAPFDSSAVARVVEFGVRRAGHRDKLSTHFTYLKDVIVEAAYWLRKEGGEVVRTEHVRKAIAAKETRANLTERKVRESIVRGEVIIDTDGEAVGQVNGLAMYRLGDHVFGAPSRITASVGVGRAGLINIEREAALSGSTHDKGVLILAGFLRRRFATKRPIALSASVCFEQNYGGVDGDSASSTEAFALLSALSGIPIRQSFAVTGSIDQLGEIQPVGGVNEKVEGFFDVCRERGLSGGEGVIIPRRNVGHLMLRHDVVEAVREGLFRIAAIETVDEGIEILTGRPAGSLDAGGRYPEGSVNHRVARRLDELASDVRAFGSVYPAGGV